VDHLVPDRRIDGSAIGAIVPVVTLYLVRHAHAGTRAGWAGADDFERPLSDKGQSQARYFAAQVGDRPIRKLWSSRAVRCTQTLDPLAARLGLDVRVAPALTEGADPDDAITFLLDHARHDAAFCSHGDLIPKVIRRLTAAGMRTSDANIATKGSWWALEVDAGRITGGRYFPHGTD
jgi:8-oxo-dGTP diphosphatase